MTAKLTPSIIESRIHTIRGVRVMLDSDLAELYETETKRITEAVKRNPERFPADFAFQLTADEERLLRSQIAASNEGRGGRRYRSGVFTEHGVAMLSSVLRSPQAVKVNVEIIRAFVRLRRLLATPGEVLTRLQEIAETVQFHDVQIKQITQVLKQMLAPPPLPHPKRKMGFHPPEPESKD